LHLRNIIIFLFRWPPHLQLPHGKMLGKMSSGAGTFSFPLPYHLLQLE
jgi:hypothetical protein